MKLYITAKIKKNQILPALSINPNEKEVAIVSEDKTLHFYSLQGEEINKPISIDSFITALVWFPASTERTKSDLLAVSCSDGSLLFMNSRNGHIDKNITAHEGAIIGLKWNMDGTSLATAGEEGEVKIWSRTGNLRTKLVSFSKAVYSLTWGIDDSLLVANQNKLIVLRTQARGKNIQWDNHPEENGVVLSVDWNVVNNLIISGGEDRCYRIFDSTGLLLFTSNPHEQVITSITWRPNGTFFSVGSFNIIKICDKEGVEVCAEEIKGSIMNMEWTPDSSQLLSVCGSGISYFTHFIGKTIEKGGASATLIKPNKIVYANSTSEEEYSEELEFSSGAVIEFALDINTLVVCTMTKCHIYQLKNLNTSYTVDLKDRVNLIAVSSKIFALVCSKRSSGILIYSNNGKFMSSSRFQGFQPELITEDSISLSMDTLAVIDKTDRRIIRLFDVMTGKPRLEAFSDIHHDIEICKVEITQYGSCFQDRRIAFIDRKNELFISTLTHFPGVDRQYFVKKIATQVHSFAWDDSSFILASCIDSKVVMWLYPDALYFDKDLLSLTTLNKAESQFGSSLSHINSFHSSQLCLNGKDGTLFYDALAPHYSMLYECAKKGDWKEAVKICRFLNDFSLWGILSGLALQNQELDIAETSFSSLKNTEKANYVKRIKGMRCIERKNAELLLFRKCRDEAISILLQANPPLAYRAIKFYIRSFMWDKALSVALKQNKHVEIALWYRRRYLRRLHKEENNKIYKQCFEKYSDRHLHDERIRKLRRQAKENEERRHR